MYYLITGYILLSLAIGNIMVDKIELKHKIQTRRIELRRITNA